MIESKLQHGDRMVMVIKVWELLPHGEYTSMLEHREGLSHTMTFRIELRPDRLVLVTASPLCPRACANGNPPLSVDAKGREALAAMLLDYRLSDGDRFEAQDEMEAFLAEHMP